LARFCGKIKSLSDEKAQKLRTLGIIGGGIVGKSLLFSLACEHRQKYDRVVIFESEDFAPACTLRTTSIVAARGVLPGIGPLGDSIHQGILDFKDHVKKFAPQGVYPIYQITSAQEKMDYFLRRYKEFSHAQEFRGLAFTKELPLYIEDAYYVNPSEYCDWLYQWSAQKMNVIHKKDFVVSIDEELNVKTHNNETFKFDHLILAGSIKNKLWSSLVTDSKVTRSKPVKGSYLLFKNIDWGNESYSLSMDGLNLIYRAPSHELLIGATSDESELYSLVEKEFLSEAYLYFSNILQRSLPDFKKAEVFTGIREKSSKRQPYLGTEKNVSYIGGLYKNGFTLSLKMARTLVSQLF